MRSDIWINGGYFVLGRRSSISCSPARTSSRSRFSACSRRGKVLAQRHDGFWAPMDTLKDKQWLETLHEERQRALAGLGPRPRHRTAISSYAASA